MKALRMLIFLFFHFLSSCISVPLGPHHHRNAHLHKEPQKCGIDTQGNTNYEDTNCACFEKGQTNIVDVLTLNDGGNSLQRLVIFLYKDPVTNSIQVYSPKKVKQALFPDLALEQEDNIIYNGNTLTLEQLFDNNYAVDVNKPNNDISQGNYLTDILNFTTDENSLPSVVLANIIPEIEFQPDISRYPEEDNKLVTVHSEGDPVNVVTNSEEDPSLDYFKSVVPMDDNDFAYIGHGGREGFHVMDLPQVNPLLTDQENIQQPFISSEDFVSHSPVITNALYDNKVQPTENNDSEKLLDQYPEAGLVSTSHLPTIMVDNYLSDMKTNFPVYTFDSESMQPNQLNKLQNIHLTFDKWFDEQMKRVQNTGQSPIKNVELPSLKHLIQKTLYENGLYVTKDGVLIDSTGKALDASNLKLRPILIGDSVAYDSLFAMKDGKYELPANLPYLEAVLVTLVYPPKILGVIPLGKKFVPRESYLIDHDYWASIARKRMRQCRSKQCFLENQRLYNYYVTDKHQTLESGYKTAVATAEAHPLLVAAPEAHPHLVAMAESHPHLVAKAKLYPLLNQSQQKSVQQLKVKLSVNPVPQLIEKLNVNPVPQLIEKLNVNPVPQLIGKLNVNPVPQLIEKLNVNPVQQLIEKLDDNQLEQKPDHQLEKKPIVITSRNRISGRHRNNFNGILKAIRSMVGSGWDKNKGETQRKEESGKVAPLESGSNENKSTGDEEEEDHLPGFRIIGGFPATSSGTPVSSKGRSGYPNYQSKMGYRL